MGRPRPAVEHAERATAARVSRELAALNRMTGQELAARFEELVGTPPRVRSKQLLRKRLAWEIQARIEGGLSDRARQRISELEAEVPARWKRVFDPLAKGTPLAAREQHPVTPTRDPRLPPVGAVLTRLHAGKEHRVAVLDGSFEYRGKSYRSLSAIAREITGTPWNGFLFFLGRSGGTRKAG